MEWEVIYAIDPWGEWRADLRMGILAAAVVSPHLKKGTKMKPADFMPDFTGEGKKRKPRQSVADQKAAMKAAVAGWNKARGK